MQIEIAADELGTAFGYAFAHAKTARKKTPKRSPARPVAKQVMDTAPKKLCIEIGETSHMKARSVNNEPRTIETRRKRGGKIVTETVLVVHRRLVEDRPTSRHLPAKCKGQSGVNAMLGFHPEFRVWDERNWALADDAALPETLDEHEHDWRLHADLAKEVAEEFHAQACGDIFTRGISADDIAHAALHVTGDRLSRARGPVADDRRWGRTATTKIAGGHWMRMLPTSDEAALGFGRVDPLRALHVEQTEAQECFLGCH